MSRYFAALYKQALAVDSKALPLVMMLKQPMNGARFHTGDGSFWGHKDSFDVMVTARKLMAELDGWFTECLQNMLIKGKIVVSATGPDGKRHRVTDPRVIDFDDPQMPEETFNELLMTYAAVYRACASSN
jgi:hypothetical protein